MVRYVRYKDYREFFSVLSLKNDFATLDVRFILVELRNLTEELISLLLYLWLRGGGGAAAGMEIPRDIFQGIIFSPHDQITYHGLTC